MKCVSLIAFLFLFSCNNNKSHSSSHGTVDTTTTTTPTDQGTPPPGDNKTPENPGAEASTSTTSKSGITDSSQEVPQNPKKPNVYAPDSNAQKLKYYNTHKGALSDTAMEAPPKNPH